MVPNAAIRNLIREDKLHQIYSQMQIGQAQVGMQTMNQSLVRPVPAARPITLEDALGRVDRGRRAEDHDPVNGGGSLGGIAPPANQHTKR